MLRRIAELAARQPRRVLATALLTCALLAAGFLRFGVDAGQSLLVGSSSATGQANQRFTAAFGTDPIVVVLTARNPTAPYLERNLQRLTALEEDLAHDPRVAQVLGPGTVANAALRATTQEVSKTLTEYPYFVAETDYLVSRQKGVTDTGKLQAQFQSDLTNAQQLLELYVARAAADAHTARAAYQQKPIPLNDRILDGQERAAEAAVAADPMPPLFAEYLAGPGNAVDTNAARQFFDRLTAAFGDCDASIAQLEGITPTCQVYLTRILLDLPHCPTEAAVKAAQARGSQVFCTPKGSWAAVLPAPSTAGNGTLVSREVITVRLTAAASRSRADVLGVRDKISTELAHGIALDAYTRTFSSAQLGTVRQLGPLAPTECGSAGQQLSGACYASYHDAPFRSVIAGAPLLTYGVVDSMTVTLIVLLPFVAVLMAILLLVFFRVRGRLWPLLAAGAAAVGTVGLALLTGTAVTPAVLAGIPVLVGLAVDYSVQLVARHDEARGNGLDRDAAMVEAMTTTGPATGTAAVATLAGLATLVLFAGVDAGPLVAIPLVAEFALILGAGVAISWLAALFVALPAAALTDARRAARSSSAAEAPTTPRRTLAVATSWRGALVPAVLVALVGWVLLPRVPVQTQADQLLAASLPQLRDVNTVRDQTGYGNELDIFIQGQVAGPNGQAGVPANVLWQCERAEDIRSLYGGQVALATSIADFFIASASSATSGASAPCVASASSSGAAPASPSPSASPSAAASGSATPTPTASPAATPSAVRPPPDAVLAAATVTPTPAPTTPPASPAPTSPAAAATPTATPSPGATRTPTQTAFLCDLRLLPDLSRDLVQPIATSTQPCPAIDKYLNAWLSADKSPLQPTSSRIVVGVDSSSIADEARLVDSLRGEIASPPGGMSATPVGLAALAAQAYDNIQSRALLLNLLPLAVVFLALLAVERDVRRAVLPVLPTAIAAGWAPLVLLLLGLLPGNLGRTLGSFNPLTVVLGALVIALATEFGVVLLRRYDEERARGLAPDAAAGAALAVTGRAIAVSALTLGGGFAVLAASALLPGGLPLLGAFGLTVVVDLALAVGAVFGIMLPLAVAIDRATYVPAVESAVLEPAVVPARVVATEPEPEAPRATAPAPAAAPPRRRSVSGRRRGASAAEPPGSIGEPPATASPGDVAEPSPAPRRPGVSGRRRRPPSRP